MGFMKRAGLYCIRQRFKTFILFLLLTLIAAFMLTGIAIRNAAKGAAADVQTAIGGKILLDVDTDGHMGDGQPNQWGGMDYSYNGDYITQEIVDAIKTVDGVVDYNVEEASGYYGAGVNFKYLPSSLGLSYTPYGESSSYTVTLSSEKCKAFQSGKYKLVEGRHITANDKYTCLISKELADYNKLSVGAKIKMYSLDADGISDNSDGISEFEIIGIFDGTEGSSGNAMLADEIPANCGYVDYGGVEDIFKDNDGDDGYSQLSIYVEDPVSIQNVYDKISALPELKGKTLKLTIDTEEYDVVSTPLDSLQTLMNTILIIISAASIVILTLLLTIWIRGRKKEIGILLSIGKNRAAIILQIFTETFIVAVISFATSIPFSNMIAQKTGAYLLSGIGAETTSLNVQIDAAYLLPLYIIGILIITVSVIASSWSVIHSKPKDILVKMS